MESFSRPFRFTAMEKLQKFFKTWVPLGKVGFQWINFQEVVIEAMEHNIHTHYTGGSMISQTWGGGAPTPKGSEPIYYIFPKAE